MGLGFRRGALGGSLVRRVAPRIVLLALLWWVLAGDASSSWWFGAPAVVAAAFVGVALSSGSSPRPTPLGTARFVPFFLRQSLVGGADVALRALRPGLPLAPCFLEYRLRLPDGRPTHVTAIVISLLPGTLAADVGDGGRLRVHALTGDQDVEGSVRELEARVADLFGLDLRSETPARDGGGGRT